MARTKQTPPTNEEWARARAALDTGLHVCLTGPPGCGKTHLAMAAAAARNLSVVRAPVHRLTDPDSLLGHYVPKGQEWQFTLQALGTAITQGAVVVADELDRASEEFWTALHPALDGHPICLANGQALPIHKHFQFVGTMNGDPRESLPPALVDRLIIIPVTTVNPEALESLPKDLWDGAQATCAQECDENRRLTFRQWQRYSHLRDAMQHREAAFLAFGEKAVEISDYIKIATA